jgi:GDP-L-fucose synthase
MDFSLSGKTIFVAGHRGMVGSAIVRRLEGHDCEILTADRSQLNLLDQAETRDWLARHKPDAVILAAAKVGGILANSTYPVDFLYDNLMIAANVIEATHRADINRLLFLGSSCIYPKFAEQPILEESLLTGALEPTNEWYAVAKIAGIKLCQAYRHQFGRDYISAMPTNLYGPFDNFDLDSSHVLPALIRKVHEAKLANSPSITIWGTGTPRREFLHVDDCADACLVLLQSYSGASQLNVGSGEDISIENLAQLVCDTVGFTGKIERDLTKPDGTPRKLMSSKKLRDMGWRPRASLKDGIEATYRWYLEHQAGRGPHTASTA